MAENQGKLFYRQWLFTGNRGNVVVEEAQEVNEMAIACYYDDGSTKRIWLTKDQFDALCGLKFEIKYVTND